MASAVPFYVFCEEILGLKLTTGQRVVAKVVFGDENPAKLTEEEKELAQEMLGSLEPLPVAARRVIVLRLGRGSGKTTISSAWSTYTAVTASLHRCGPGDIPVAVTVAPDKNTAKLSIRMAREMIRANPHLNALVEESSEERIDLRRPDGRRVAIEAFAASRGGSSVRGRSILTFLLDEAEFFRSDDTGSYLINDRDIYGALMPRLLPGGKGVFLSTPWPVDTMMAEEFEKNFGHPKTCIAVKATTLQMRGEGDLEIQQIVAQELERDPDNARREYFCEVDRLGGGEFFDPGALQTSLDALSTFPVPRNNLWPTAIGADFAFKQDSSALCVVQFDGRRYQVADLLELKPRKGTPLKPSEVVREFAAVCKRYNTAGIISDGHYREAVKEHLSSYGLALWDAPEGVRGKMDVFARTKAVLHEGLVSIPDCPDGRRLITQAKTVVAKPAAGGGLTIRIPRRIGIAHGDLVSAWTLATHRLAYSQAKKEAAPSIEYGSPEWFATQRQRDDVADKKREQAWIKSLEREIKEERSRRFGF